MLEKLHVFISLIAAIATICFGIINEMTLREISVPVIAAIIIFYIVGLFVRNFLQRFVFISEPEITEPDVIEPDGSEEFEEIIDEYDDDENEDGVIDVDDLSAENGSETDGPGA